ncbi:MAG TPA: alpha/beta fold hydrolase [Gemmatimonadaceae bacterium]
MAAARVLYPFALEWRHARRLRAGPDGIVIGAEPIDLARSGAPAVLLLHGGGDTPQSLRGLAEFLFTRGYAVRVPLLADHGRTLRNLRQFDALKWRAQVRAEIEQMRTTQPWLAIVGQSVGGALALDAAASNQGVRALVLLAPWVAMPQFVRRLARWSRVWGPLFPYLPSLGGHSIHDPVARSQALTQGLVTPEMLRAIAAVADMADRSLPRVTVPTLTIQSREDPRIAEPVAQRGFDRLGASEKKLEWMVNTGHVISVDYGRDRVHTLAADWLDSHRG